MIKIIYFCPKTNEERDRLFPFDEEDVALSFYYENTCSAVISDLSLPYFESSEIEVTTQSVYNYNQLFRVEQEIFN